MIAKNPTTYGILCPPAQGHLNPFMALARELKERGHRPIFYQLLDYASALTHSGFEVRTYGEREFPAGAWRESSARFSTLSGEAAMLHFIEAVERKTLAGLRDLPSSLRADGVQAILADQVGMESSSIAEILGIPFATLCNALPLDSDSTTPPFFTDATPSTSPELRLRNWIAYQAFDIKVQPTLSLVNRWRLQNGLKPHGHRRETYSPLLKMIRLHPTFDFPRRANAQTQWIGPLIFDAGRPTCAFPWERLDGRPIIYVSMGSEINRRFANFQRIINAFEKENVQLVVSLGRADADPAEVTHGPATIVCPFVPQIDILRKAFLFVTHAGLNSVLESICAGVPMLALPSANDQFGIAARIRHQGIGDYLREEEITEGALRNSFQRIIAGDRARNQARNLAAGISSGQAASTAADLVEKLPLHPDKIRQERTL